MIAFSERHTVAIADHSFHHSEGRYSVCLSISLAFLMPKSESIQKPNADQPLSFISSPHPSPEPSIITFLKLLSKSISTKSNPQTNNHISSRSRLARRGGVKRLSTQIYDEIRTAMQDRLKLVSSQVDHNTATQGLVSC